MYLSEESQKNELKKKFENVFLENIFCCFSKFDFSG